MSLNLVRSSKPYLPSKYRLRRSIWVSGSKTPRVVTGCHSWSAGCFCTEASETGVIVECFSIMKLRSCRATPRLYCHCAAQRQPAIRSSASSDLSSENFSRVFELLNSSRPLLEYRFSRNHCLTASICYNYCNIGQDHSAHECKPSIRTGQYHSQNKAGCSHHHGKKISTLPRTLVFGKAS